MAGAVAWGWCWATELFQLTGIPADLSARSLLSRMALGVRFDLVDLFWYPAGIVPLVALHWFLARRSREDGRPGSEAWTSKAA
ncbi:Protein of unknown function [Asanoa hainanensis]|uniref:Uncharacterized protein n=1 Tax=Asanoa hainanensis TaxID=560556 RepID=A0A239NYY6_9ACTN|nr:Protein of unknown function [Asanoa hainanensis]